MKLISYILLWVLVLLSTFPGFSHDESALNVTSPQLQGIDESIVKFNDFPPLTVANGPLVSLEEQDAMVVEYVLIQTIKSMQISVKLVSTLMRIVADTVAGILSGVIKSFGGVFNLLSNIASKMSSFLQNSSSEFGQKSSKNFGSVSKVLKGVGDSCIWSGDIVELFTSSMGEALEDSFRSLEVVTESLNYLVHFLFHRNFTSVKIDSGNVTQAQSNYTKEEYDTMIREQNTLYSHHKQPSEDPTDDSAIEPSKSFHAFHFKNKLGDRSIHKLKTAEELQSVADHSEDSDSAEPTDWKTVVLKRYQVVEALVLSGCRSFVSDLQRYWNSSVSNSLDVPSIGSYLLLALLVMCIVNLVDYSSLMWRLTALLLSISVLWFYIMSVEHSQRVRLIQRTSVKSIHSYLTRQTAQYVSNHSYSSNSTSSMKKFSKHKVGYENSVWVNVLMSALWNIDGSQGLGAYVNSVYEELLIEELAKVPSGVANVKLRKFDLGSNPPLVKGIRMRTSRDKQCVAAVLSAARLAIDDRNADRTSNSTSKSQKYIDKFLSFVSQQQTALSKSDVPKKDRGLHSGNSLLNECDEVELDIDFAYASKDMDIVMSMRHEDSKSVLPEFSVTLSEVMLSGQLSMLMKVTPDYPFLGDATVGILGDIWMIGD